MYVVKISGLSIPERKSMSNTLRSKVRAVLRSKDDSLLIETGFTYPSGSLTLEGRKVVTDMLFETDENLRKNVLDVARKLKDS